MQRLVYYACSQYVEQLQSGDNYATLKTSISICILNSEVLHHSTAAQHRFRMLDSERDIEIPNAIEVHTVELPKYNLCEETIREATAIEQWVFFFLNADQFDADRLCELLPRVEFQQAITVLESIAAKTRD